MEHNWKEILLPAFEIRKSKAQKQAFIDLLAREYGDRMHVEESGSLVKTRNIVIGSPESAKIVYTAHYDTCARLPFPNFITPRNIFVFLLYQIGVALLFVIPVLALEILAAYLTRNAGPLVSLIAAEGTLILFLVFFLWVFLIGTPNPHTANDNTSGVVTVLSLADRLADSPDAAFILFDNEEVGLLGSMAYAGAHPDVKKNTLIVNFDCVSDGDHFLVIFSKEAQKRPLYEELRARMPALLSESGKDTDVCPKRGTVYPSDQASFKTSVAVCALNKSPLVGLYMNKIHTPKDTVFDERNIALLLDTFAPEA
ncbi:MAG: M28 family peptidase [Clostridia bacterium]|nr:M28 family peptidase [Clostridia bacterium]